MIGVLGFKRVVFLLGLIGFNVLLALAIYMYMTPELDNVERQRRTVRGEVSTLRGDISRMQVEYDQFIEQQIRFEGYKKDGFFVQQNRRQVEDILKTIQEKSGVATAKVSVSPAETEDNAEAAKAEHKLLKSEIKVEVEALEDTDIFHYIFLIEKYFPGHITINSVEYERAGEINGTILRAIASGRNVPLVKADMKFEWRTMIPESQLIVDEE